MKIIINPEMPYPNTDPDRYRQELKALLGETNYLKHKRWLGDFFGWQTDVIYAADMNMVICSREQAAVIERKSRDRQRTHNQAPGERPC